jgi:hypothetical protein
MILMLLLYVGRHSQHEQLRVDQLQLPIGVANPTTTGGFPFVDGCHEICTHDREL